MDAAWVTVDLVIISALVRIIGGIASEAALVYFWPIVTYSIQRRLRGAVGVGAGAVLVYVAATWPADPSIVYLEKLGTRIFILLLVTVLAACYALHEIARVEEIASLFAEGAGVSAPLAIQGSPVALPPDVEQATFRIIQEALTNAEKHGHAAEVKVGVEFAPGVLKCAVETTVWASTPPPGAASPASRAGSDYRA